MKLNERIRRRWRKFFGSEEGTGLLWTSMDRVSFENRSTVDFLRYNEINLYVNRALAIRAEKVSDVKFILKNKKGDPIDDPFDPMLLLLTRPNKLHTGKQFWKLVQLHLDIAGEAYILKAGRERGLFETEKVQELYVLPPHLVKVNFEEDGVTVKNYEYAGSTKTDIYPPEQVIRIFEPDPICPSRGVSLLRAGIRQIETDLQLTEYQANILKNGGFVDGVFKFKTTLTSVQLREMEERYKEKVASAKKAGIPMFLGGDADYIRLALAPAELAYLESKKLTLDDVATMTGVPRALLARASDETYANADAALAIFLRETIAPRIKNLVTFLDWRLVPEDRELDFEDPTPANKEDIRKDLETANTVNAMTTNEKREKLGEIGIELEPIEDPAADQILIPLMVTPLTEPAAPRQPAPGGEPKRFKDGKSPACRRAGETKEECMGRKIPEIMRENPNMENDQAVAIASKLCSVACEGKGFAHPLRDPVIRKKWGELQLKRLDRRTGKFRTEMRRYFNEQKGRIIGHMEGQYQKGILESVLDKTLELKLAKGFAIPLLRQFLADAGADAFSLMGSRFEFQLTAGIESWLDKRGNIFADEITKTTFDKLGREFADSFDLGESRQQLIERIGDVYDGFDEERATTIARTEVHGAMQKGTEEGYRQSGVDIKIWVWASGVQGGVRPEHMAIDGEEVPLEMPFSNGLMFPGDPSADPGETVNCECSI